jgi:hypothetical protein
MGSPDSTTVASHTHPFKQNPAIKPPAITTQPSNPSFPLNGNV